VADWWPYFYEVTSVIEVRIKCGGNRVDDEETSSVGASCNRMNSST
jgi:hypothetical protein